MLCLAGNITLRFKQKTSKLKYKMVIYGLCIYWPLLIYYLWKGRDKK